MRVMMRRMMRKTRHQGTKVLEVVECITHPRVGGQTHGVVYGIGRIVRLYQRQQ
jgi:hypothetical protein